ncbi:MAG TPA: aldo/keto reductase, partial [Rubellimicrobium sp.]|nr:aldo/keto reductase [Rubellimicrobium sp.]
SRPGVSSLLLGASRPQQVTDNIAALEVRLSEDQAARLDAVGAPPALNPYFIFQLPREMIFGGPSVTPWAAA